MRRFKSEDQKSDVWSDKKNSQNNSLLFSNFIKTNLD